jgi:5'(3')-deoxyribonucleotidase
MARRKRLLIDVDEVLVDFQTPTFDIIHRLLGRRLRPEDYEVWDMFGLFTDEERTAIFTEIEQPGFCRALKPTPGARLAVEELRSLVDVFPVTSHFHSQTWVHERDASLKEHFGFTKREIVHTGAKFLVAGDYFLDDNPSHVEGWVAEHPDGCGMLWHIPNTRTLGFEDIRMHSWGGVIERIKTTLDRPTVYDLLDEREWSREGDPYPAGNYCQTCGASERGSKVPRHKDGCLVDKVLTWHRNRG